PRRRPAWPEGGDSAVAKRVGEPPNERCLGTDDHEVDLDLAAKREQRFSVLGTNRVALAEARDSGIPRRGVECLEARALAELPGERVLSTARADDQDPHAPSLLAVPAPSSPAAVLRIACGGECETAGRGATSGRKCPLVL